MFLPAIFLPDRRTLPSFSSPCHHGPDCAENRILAMPASAKRGYGAVVLVASMLGVGAPTTQAANSPVLTVVRFDSGEGTATHWSHAFTAEAGFRLSKVSGIVTRSSRFGRRQLSLAADDVPTRDQAVRIGQLVEAQWVLRGSARERSIATRGKAPPFLPWRGFA